MSSLQDWIIAGIIVVAFLQGFFIGSHFSFRKLMRANDQLRKEFREAEEKRK